jgi:hypothetical protein
MFQDGIEKWLTTTKRSPVVKTPAIRQGGVDATRRAIVWLGSGMDAWRGLRRRLRG